MVVDEVVNVVEDADVGVVGLLVVVKGVVVLNGLLILFVVVDVTWLSFLLLFGEMFNANFLGFTSDNFIVFKEKVSGPFCGRMWFTEFSKIVTLSSLGIVVLGKVVGVGFLRGKGMGLKLDVKLEGLKLGPTGWNLTSSFELEEGTKWEYESVTMYLDGRLFWGAGVGRKLPMTLSVKIENSILWDLLHNKLQYKV